MAENKNKPEPGSIAWQDLTVTDAEKIRDFYSKVVGWKSSPVSMGDYDDYNMNTPKNGQTVAGICHSRGMNADLPAQWLIYIIVENLDHSIEQCRQSGGKIIAGPNNMGNNSRYCVIQDPAGAVAALYEIL